MLGIGTPAPEFSLPDQNGITHTLGEYRGKWLVVYFYPKDDTPGCTVEACSIRDAKDDLTQAGVAVVGISKDTIMSHKKFAEKFDLNFPILADPSIETIQAYGAWQEKSMYGRKYMGIQRMTVIINPNGIVAHIFPKVTPRGHEKEILKTIQSLSSATSDTPSA